MVPIGYQLRYVLFFLCHAVQFLNSVNSVGYLQVVAKMRDMVSNDTQNPVSNSFLLDDDLRLVIRGLSFLLDAKS